MDSLFSSFAVPGFGEIALTLAMIFITVLLLGFLISSKWHWVFKASATAAAGLFFALTYFSIIEMQGWPTTATIPNDFQLVWFYVDQPNKRINKPGFIVLWALEVNEKIGKKPRAYMIPYNKETHKKLNKAKKQMRKGSKMRGTNTTGKSKKKYQGADSSYKIDLKFYKMPPPNPPRK